MGLYTIYFSELNEITIEADNEKQATEMFYRAEYDNPQYISTNIVEVEEE